VRGRAIQLGARLGWAEAVAMAIEMANALGHVHERAGSDGTPLGIVHRDLSPQNVMVGYVGEVKLIDFGTARGQNRKCHTVAGVVFAKPGYVAPEVANGALVPPGQRVHTAGQRVQPRGEPAVVGGLLVTEALRLAREARARTVDLTTRPARESAGRLYERAGFQQRETRVYRYAFR